MVDRIWFRHEANSRNDPRMVALLRRHGLAGIGAFWCVIEIMRESTDYRIDADRIDDIEYSLHADGELAPIIETALEIGLFERDDTAFFSPALTRRMSEYDAFVESRRRAANERWKRGKSDQDADDMHVDSTSNARAMQRTGQDRTEQKEGKEGRLSIENSANFRSWLREYAMEKKSIHNPGGFVQSFFDETLNRQIRNEVIDKYREFEDTQPLQIANGGSND